MIGYDIVVELVRDAIDKELDRRPLGTQGQLAKDAKWARCELSTFVRGKLDYRPGPKRLQRLADAIGLDLRVPTATSVSSQNAVEATGVEPMED